VFGDGVNVAARVRPHADPGGVCVTSDAGQALRNQANLIMTSLGAHGLKNVPRAIELFTLGGTPAAPAASRAHPSRPRTRQWIAAATVVVIAAAVGGWLLHLRAEGSATAPIRAIAVLPFVTMSAAQGQEYFADGLTEELINALAHVPDLRVTARTSAFAFKGKREDVRSVAKQLGVDAIIEGSVRQDRERLRITAQLIRASDGFHLWSQTFDHVRGDVFAVQEKVARDVFAAANARSAAVTAELPQIARPTLDARAWELYQRGRFFYLQGPDGYRQAVESYGNAIALDPQFALAHARLAMALAEQWDWWMEPADALARADEASLRGLALGDSLADTHFARAWVALMLGRWSEWETEVERGRSIDPTSIDSLTLQGDLLMDRGRQGEALALIERARELDPLSAKIRLISGQYRIYARDLTGAESELRRALELSPGSPYVRRFLGRALLEQGRVREAMTEFANAAYSPPIAAEFGKAAATGNWRSGVSAVLAAGRAETGRACSVDPGSDAFWYAYLGNPDAMLTCLETAIARRQFNRLPYLLSDPVFAPYRSAPRFVAVLRALGHE
jgi:TolB-like protein